MLKRVCGRKVELIGPLGGEGEADHAAPVHRHEVDQLGRDPGGGTDQVTLVLPVLIVRDDHHATGVDVADGVFDAVELHRVVGWGGV